MKKAIIVVIGALALLPAAYATPSRTARVAITDLSPFTVYGSGFAVGERVTITVSTKQRVVRRAVANVRGAFTARFATVSLGRCNSYVVRAVGNHGSSVTKKVTPECAPPATSGEGQEPPALYPADPTPKKKP